MAKLKGKFIEDATITENKLDINNSPTDNYVLTWDDGSGKPQWESGATSDNKDVKVSTNDTTPGFLEGKLVGTANLLTLTETDDGGNETLTINVGDYVLNKNTDDTDDVDEGSNNKYYTDARVSTYIGTIKGEADGLASLDGSGKVPQAQLPAIALTEIDVVADITARDALTPQEGDVAIVNDASDDPNVDSGGASYIYDGSAWQLLKDPTEAVTSVNGNTGVVTLTTTDISEGDNEYYTDARARGAISDGTGITYNSGTGEIALTDTTTIEQKKVEIFTLDGDDITNKYVDLTNVPVDGTAVEVTPVGGIPQEYTTDFSVITDGSDVKRLNWSTLGLDGVVEATDKLIVSYTY